MLSPISYIGLFPLYWYSTAVDSYLFGWKFLEEELEDPTLSAGKDAKKELSRARKVMGATWVSQVSLVAGLVHVFEFMAQFLFRLNKGVTSY